MYGFFVFSGVINGAGSKELALPCNEYFEDRKSAEVAYGDKAPINTPVEELEDAKISGQDKRILTQQNFTSERLYTVGRFAVKRSLHTDQELFKAKKKEAQSDRDVSEEKSCDEQDLEKI